VHGVNEYVSPANAISRAGAGVVGGLTGGVLLGIALQIMGFMPSMAALVGRSSTTAAWVTHLGIAAIAGALYGILVGLHISRQVISAIGVGLVYGGALGALLVLLLLPIVGDGDVFSFTDRAMQGLLAYAIFGVVMGVIYAMTGPKRRYYDYVPRRQQLLGFVSSVARPRRRRRKRDDD
jgi:hypothetical protein